MTWEDLERIAEMADEISFGLDERSFNELVNDFWNDEEFRSIALDLHLGWFD